MSFFQIFVKDFGGKSHTITLPDGPETTVSALREVLFEATGVPVATQLLVFAGKQLEDKGASGGDDFTLGDYGVMRESTLHLVTRLHGGR